MYSMFIMYSYNVQYENGFNIFEWTIILTLLLKVKGNFKHKK